MSSFEITTIGDRGRTYIFPDGTRLALPEDIDLIPRVMEELEARRRYGQSCDRIELGADAWEWTMWNQMLLEMDAPPRILFFGMPASLNCDLAPTCFRVL